MAREFLILGYFGAGNLGDDLMLRGLVRLLQEHSPGRRIRIVSYYDRALPVNESAGLRIVRARTPWQKLRILIPLFVRRPIVFFGGGTPFTDTEGDGSYKFFRLASLFGCSFGYLGVGIGRLTVPERRRRAQWLLRRCAAAMFRDPESMRRAQELVGGTQSGRFMLGEDLAYLDVRNWSSRAGEESVNATAGDVVLSWRELSGEEGDQRHEALLRALKTAMAGLRESMPFARLTLLPLDPDVDLAVHRLLERELRDVLPGVAITLLVTASTAEAIRTIAGARLLLCVRLHGAFVGKTLGVPTVGFEYSPKLRYFFDSIGSRSLLRWDELLQDPDCLLRMAGTAVKESAAPPDPAPAVAAARQGVVDFIEAFP